LEKVLINTFSVHERTGGIKTYLTHLVGALAETAPNRKFVLLCSKDNSSIFRKYEAKFPNVSIVICLSSSRNPIFRIFYEQFVLPFKLRAWKNSTLLVPSSVAILLSRLPQVVIQQYPQAIPAIRNQVSKQQLTVSRFQRFYYDLFVPVSLKKAYRNVAVSNHLLQNILKDYPDAAVNSALIHEGVDMGHFVPKENGNSGRNLLFISSLFPYKNAALLVKAYANLPLTLRQKYPLRIVGKDPDGQQYSILSKIIAEKSLDRQATLVGMVPFDLIQEEYNNAIVFAYTSSVETFGLPVLEAMAMGVPVVASDAMSIPEVVGDAGILFRDGDIVDLTQKLEELLTQEALREKFRAKGFSQVQSFTWQKCGQAFNQIFDSIN